MFLDQLVKSLKGNAYKWGFNVFKDDRPLQSPLTVMLRINCVSNINILSGDRRLFDGNRMTYDIHILSKNDTEQYEEILFEALNQKKCKPIEHSHMRKLDGNVHHSIETYTWIGAKWRVNDDTEQL